jgi:hypothetical protein
VKSSSVRNRTARKKMTWIFFISGLSVLLAAGITVLLLYLNGFFYQRNDIDIRSTTASAPIEERIAASTISPSSMEARIVSALVKNTKTSPYTVHWYTLPGNISSIPALESEYLLAYDQILLLRSYIDSGKQKEAATLLKAIDRDFTGDEGYLVPFRKVTELSSLSSPQPRFATNEAYDEPPVASVFSTEATVEYLRAVLEYYDKWGQPSDWTRIIDLADLLYSDMETSGMLPEDMTIVVAPESEIPLDENKYIVSIITEEVQQEGSFTALSLSSLDLEVFRIMSSIDVTYQILYDESLLILRSAMISEELPLYALGYSGSAGGYVYFSGEKPEIDLVSSLKVILHLAEAGEESPLSILWLKEKLYNDGILYQSYNIISGSETGAESEDAYGLVLQIARITDDADLYAAALTCLERNLATSYTSEARHAIFRRIDESRIVLYAKDNLQARLGM